MGFVFPSNPFASPNMIAVLVMLAWFPAVIYIFTRLPARRALIISFLVAWLFLPQASRALPGLPDYTRISATCYSIVLATIIFDFGRIKNFRINWFDIPMLVWCLCPFGSSISNGLGAYDGFSASLEQTVTWGLPYFLGRVYLKDLLGLRQLATNMVVFGLIYVPLCLYEVRMSPQLHAIVYGGKPFANFTMAMRLGGWRPNVFMLHGLALAGWMAAVTLVCIWLYQARVVPRFWKIPIGISTVILLANFVLLRSTGAYFLLASGVAIMLIARYLRTALPMILLIAGMSGYLYLNAFTETYITDQIITSLSSTLPAERIQSLEFRFNNEERLADKARQRIVWGWGGWGRALIYSKDGKLETVQDSLWIIAFGHHGAIGLISYTMAMLVPVLGFVAKFPASTWFRREIAPAAALNVALVLYFYDCLLNAMLNPMFVLICGGITSIVVSGNPASLPATRRVAMLSPNSPRLQNPK